MTPDQAPQLRAALDALLARPPRDLRAAVADLLARFDLRDPTEDLRARSRKCRERTAYLASLPTRRSSSSAAAYGLPRVTLAHQQDGTIEWCPRLDLLVVKRVSIQMPDTRWRIREEVFSSFRVVTLAECAALLAGEEA